MTFTHLPVPTVITVYGATWCGPCTRLKAQLDRLGAVYEVIDVDQNPEVLPGLAAANGASWIVPTVALPDGRVLINPSAAAVTGTSVGADRDTSPAAPVERPTT